MFSRVCVPNLRSEAASFLDVWIGGLEPEKIGVRGEFDGAFCGCRETGAVVIEAFAGARDVPVEGDRGGGV